MSKEKMVDFDIPTELYNAIEAFCEKSDMSVDQFVEKGILEFLANPDRAIQILKKAA